jgi:hypothetical protein
LEKLNKKYTHIKIQNNVKNLFNKTKMNHQNYLLQIALDLNLTNNSKMINKIAQETQFRDPRIQSTSFLPKANQLRLNSHSLST